MDRKHMVWAVALLLSVATSGNGWADSGTSVGASLAEDIEFLEPVKVTEVRIARFQRAIPVLPLDPGVTEPIQTEGLAAGTLEALPVTLRLPRRLEDETAAQLGKRTPVQYVATTRPFYPREAREMGWHGTVMVQVEVLEDGTAGSVRLGKSCGHEILDQAAIAGVKNWRFRPLTDGGFTFRTTVHVPVVFDLKDF